VAVPWRSRPQRRGRRRCRWWQCCRAAAKCCNNRRRHGRPASSSRSSAAARQSSILGIGRSMPNPARRALCNTLTRNPRTVRSGVGPRAIPFRAPTRHNRGRPGRARRVSGGLHFTLRLPCQARVMRRVVHSGCTSRTSESWSPRIFTLHQTVSMCPGTYRSNPLAEAKRWPLSSPWRRRCAERKPAPTFAVGSITAPRCRAAQCRAAVRDVLEQRSHLARAMWFPSRAPRRRRNRNDRTGWMSFR
jgi:hypothetical protein